jgi:hypothetical protein
MAHTADDTALPSNSSSVTAKRDNAAHQASGSSCSDTVPITYTTLRPPWQTHTFHPTITRREASSLASVASAIVFCASEPEARPGPRIDLDGAGALGVEVDDHAVRRPNQPRRTARKAIAPQSARPRR